MPEISKLSFDLAKWFFSFKHEIIIQSEVVYKDKTKPFLDGKKKEIIFYDFFDPSVDLVKQFTTAFRFRIFCLHNS